MLAEGYILDNRYVVSETIGYGTLGTVYLAHDKSADTEIALKIIRNDLAENKEVVNWILDLIELTKTLTHENIAKVIDAGYVGDIVYIVTEYVNGSTLAEMLNKRSNRGKPGLGVKEALDFTVQILKALKYAHGQKRPVLHFDIRPSNIMIDDLDRGCIKLTDFGLAQTIAVAMHKFAHRTLTRPLYYQAPEQLEGLDISNMTDIYATGVVLYEMITGEPPFTGGNIRRKIANDTPPPLANEFFSVWQWLEKCIAKEPARRPKIDELIRSVEQYVAIIPSEKPTQQDYQQPWNQNTPPTEFNEPPDSELYIPEDDVLYDDAIVHLNKGLDKYNQGKYKAAITDYTEALRCNPQYATAYYNRGLCYWKLKQTDMAMQDYLMAVKYDPYHKLALNNLGLINYERSKWDAALYYYSKALEVDRYLSLAYYNRSLVYSKIGEVDLCIQDLNEVLRLDPRDAEAYYNRGIAFRRRGDFHQAIKDYTQAINVDPQYAEAYHNRACAYLNLNDIPSAKRDFNSACRYGYKPACQEAKRLR